MITGISKQTSIAKNLADRLYTPQEAAYCQKLSLLVSKNYLRFQASYSYLDNAVTAATLSKVLNCSEKTPNSLRRLGLNETVVQAVEAVTKREEESFSKWLLRSKSNQIARLILFCILQNQLEEDKELNTFFIERNETALLLIKSWQNK